MTIGQPPCSSSHEAVSASGGRKWSRSGMGIPSSGLYRDFPMQKRLFTDAEPPEDAVEHVVGDDGADDLAELVEGEAEVDGDELVADAEGARGGGGGEGFGGAAEAVAA